MRWLGHLVHLGRMLVFERLIVLGQGVVRERVVMLQRLILLRQVVVRERVVVLQRLIVLRQVVVRERVVVLERSGRLRPWGLLRRLGQRGGTRPSQEAALRLLLIFHGMRAIRLKVEAWRMLIEVRLGVRRRAVVVAEILRRAQALVVVLGRLVVHRTNRGISANRSKRLTLEPLDLSGVGATCSLEIQMLADRIVQQTHALKPIELHVICSNRATVHRRRSRRLRPAAGQRASGLGQPVELGAESASLRSPLACRQRDCGVAKLHGYLAAMPPHGAIAQMGERLDRTQEVAGSIPASSTPAFARQRWIYVIPPSGWTAAAGIVTVTDRPPSSRA